MSGATLEVVVTDDPDDVQAPAIVLGSLAARMGGAPQGEDLRMETYRLRVMDGLVLIAGHGAVADLATSHGVYTLLRDLGCDWIMPGTDGEIIPARETVTVSVRDRQESPSFNVRQAWYGGRALRNRVANYEFYRWLQRMRMHNRRMELLAFEGPVHSLGSHAWRGFSRRKELQENPEMLALRQFPGVTPHSTFRRSGSQIETTHPRVIEIAIESIRQRFENNGWASDKKVAIGMGPADGWGMSRSEETRAIEAGRPTFDSGRPDGTDVVILFLNTILEALEDEFPNLYLSYYVYSWHANYPARYRPHPRVAIEVADINFSRFHGSGSTSSKSRAYFREILEQWGALHAEQGNIMHRYYYGYNVANAYLPLLQLRMYGEGIPFVHELGFSGLRFNFYDNWLMAGPNAYFAARLAWDYSLDWRDLLQEYCAKAFGVAADEMQQYFLAMSRRQHDAGMETGQYYSYHLIYDRPFLQEMDALLETAANRATTDFARRNIQNATVQIERLHLWLNYHERLLDFDFTGAREAHQAMRDALERDRERNVHFRNDLAMGWFNRFFNRFLEGSVQYSSAPYAMVYPVPERLKTAFDPMVKGQRLLFYGRDISDRHYIRTATFDSTWDAQGLFGYRKGAVWYRIPFTLESLPEEDGHGVGLFVGGACGVIRVW